jgi:beta-lactam-binding protein with PASTA domain
VALTPALPTAGPVTLSLHVPLATRPGSYPLSVTGTSGSASATAQVTLTVPPPCRVPRVVGRTLTAAQRALRAGHCRSNVVRRVRSSLPVGRVSRQWTPAGALRIPGFAVALAVSTGKR